MQQVRVIIFASTALKYQGITHETVLYQIQYNIGCVTFRNFISQSYLNSSRQYGCEL